MTPETLFAVALVGAFASGIIASSRGLGFGGYFVLGALLPIVGVLAALLAHPNKLAQITPAADQGWWPDPTGRFDHRYFDGRHWTKFVGRQGNQFEDPI